MSDRGGARARRTEIAGASRPGCRGRWTAGGDSGYSKVLKYLFGGCAWVKLALYVPSIYVYSFIFNEL